MNQIIDAIRISNTNKTAFFILIILTALALFGTYLPRFKGLAKYAKQSPAILATVGVFFSFWGISIGLIEFDANHMAESTPKLLEGLKVKFIASLMGIGFSIIVRIAQSFKSDNNGSVDIDSEQIMIDLLTDIKQSLAENNKDSPEQFLKELKDSIAILPVEFKKQSSLLEAIKTSLAGDGDASVTTQLAKARIDMKDGLSELDKHNKQYFDELNTHNKQYLGAINKNIKDGFDNQNTVLNNSFNSLTVKFDEFARVLAENNSKAFIEALEKAMRDFNNNITEQFGENFKELNTAVGRLLTWQEKYRIHVEQLTTNFETALSGIEIIKTTFGEIENHSQSFTTTSEKLHGILESLDRQLQDLSSHLQAFDELASNAKNAFPIIEDNLVKLTTEFTKSTGQSLTNINDAVEDVGSNLKISSGKLKDITVKICEAMDGQKDTLDSTSQDFKKVIGDTLKGLAKGIDEYRDTLQATVTEQLKVIETSVKKSNGLIDQTIQNASTTFEQSINSTGDTLKAATDKVSSQLTTATGSMQSMIETQTETLDSASKDFKGVIKQTLSDLSTETQGSIKTYQSSLQDAVTNQLDAIDKTIKDNNDLINKSIKDASGIFEQSINSTGNTLKTATDKVSSQLTTATDSMQSMIKTQTETLDSASKDFKVVIKQTLSDLSTETQSSIRIYQSSLQDAVTNQLKAIDETIKDNNKVVNQSINDASNAFKQSIDSTGETLKTATDKVSSQLTTATGSMQSMIANQEMALINASGQFETVVKQTLSDLSKETQDSLKNYQHLLNNLITEQSNIIHLAIKNAGNEFDSSIKATAEKFNGMASSIEKSVKTQEITLTDVSDNFRITVDRTLHDLSEKSKATIQSHERELQNIINNQMNSINNAITGSSKEFNRLLTQNMNDSTEILKQQTKHLDEALQEELKKAIEVMGRNLASLSRKFVDDYSPLTDKLRDVVRMAEELKRGRN